MAQYSSYNSKGNSRKGLFLRIAVHGKEKVLKMETKGRLLIRAWTWAVSDEALIIPPQAVHGTHKERFCTRVIEGFKSLFVL